MINPEALVRGLPATKLDRFLVLHAGAGGISGLLEIVDGHGGREHLPRRAESLRLEVDDLLPAVDASSLLGFAQVEQGDVILTKIVRNSQPSIYLGVTPFSKSGSKNAYLSYRQSSGQCDKSETVALRRKFCLTFWMNTSPHRNLKTHSKP
jgi:hypothetical protein